MSPGEQVDPTMMAPIERVARFIASGGEGSPAAAFADRGVIIIENFAPYLFDGPAAVEDWTLGMRAHVVGLTGLRHRFGPPQNVSRDGDVAFLSLPTEWSGFTHGRSFTEHGGWCFVLTKQGVEWRIQNYGWAVTEIAVDANE